MITLFTTCKPFEGDTAWRQMNALTSWRFLDLPVIVIGDDEGAEEAAGELGYRFVPDVERSDKGVPYVDSLFEVGQAEADTDTVAYVNADIILIPAWREVVERAEGDLIVGYCYEVEQNGLLSFREGWIKDVKDRSYLRSRWARDYFVFDVGLWDFIPPFELGMFAWDTWLRTHVPGKRVRLSNRDNFHQRHGQIPNSSPKRDYNKELEERYA
jgi:hypothetical protein